MAELLSTHHSWIIFLGAFFFGESMIITAAALAAHGRWGLTAVFGYALAGTLTSDTVWFLFSGKFSARIVDRGGPRSRRVIDWLEKKTGSRPWTALLYAKFIYGTRVLVITYMSIRRVALHRFISFDAAGTLGWLAVIITIGWFTGKGIARIGDLESNLKLVIPLIVVIALAIKGGILWLTNRYGPASRR